MNEHLKVREDRGQECVQGLVGGPETREAGAGLAGEAVGEGRGDAGARNGVQAVAGAVHQGCPGREVHAGLWAWV
jgi:hypothetical protein